MTAQPDFDVICVGSANLDTVVSVERVPLDDERMTSDSFVTAGGGPAATAAVTLARLGLRVGICGVVGDDREGELVRSTLEDEKVDTRWLRTDANARTARAVVLTSTSTGGRSIVTTIAPEPSADEIPLDRSAWLHVDQTGYRATRRALTRSGSTTKLSIDAGNPIQGLTLGGADLFAPTLAALGVRFPHTDADGALRAAQAEGARLVVATAGADGTYVLTEDGVEWVKPCAVEVVSTLGAGDVFHGALLAGIVSGHGLVEATMRANATAALACTRLDGRSGIPTLSELEAFLDTRA